MTLKNACIVCIALAVPISPTAMAHDLWLAPTGNDHDPGTKDQPLATPSGAQERVRQWIKAGLKEDVTVWFGGGVYRLQAPWVFTAEDSPGDKHSVTYAAAPGATVAITGGRQITGWQPTGDCPDFRAQTRSTKSGSDSKSSLLADKTVQCAFLAAFYSRLHPGTILDLENRRRRA